MLAKQVQFKIASVMSIRKILSPLLMISYVCGLRVVEYPAGVVRQWFGLLYMLLLWSIYNFVFIYVVIPYIISYSTLYHICYGLNMFTTLLSIIVGVYHDKTFRNCIKNLTIVDDTFKKLGIVSDYKLYARTVWFILGWFMVAILISCMEIQFLKTYNIQFAPAVYIPLIRNYCVHINIISDLVITSMLRYVGLKFDQINEHLEKLMGDNNHKIKRAWVHPVLLSHQSRCAKTLRSGYMIWIIIHLYSELRKISRKIDSIFGTQMTLEMGCYFARISLSSQEVFNVIFINNYIKKNSTLYVSIILAQLLLEVFRLFLINYECEKVSIKANATGNFISKLSYSNYDVEIRENIVQLILMTQSPLRFCGLGFFQFGFKFLQGFTTSIATVLVILLQGHINK